MTPRTLRRDAWRWFRGCSEQERHALRAAARLAVPIDSATDVGNGRVRVWFSREERQAPAALSATPWILPAAMLQGGEE